MTYFCECIAVIMNGTGADQVMEIIATSDMGEWNSISVVKRSEISRLAPPPCYGAVLRAY